GRARGLDVAPWAPACRASRAHHSADRRTTGADVDSPAGRVAAQRPRAPRPDSRPDRTRGREASLEGVRRRRVSAMSNQNYRTPPEFIDAVSRRFGPPGW